MSYRTLRIEPANDGTGRLRVTVDFETFQASSIYAHEIEVVGYLPEPDHDKVIRPLRDKLNEMLGETKCSYCGREA